MTKFRITSLFAVLTILLFMPGVAEADSIVQEAPPQPACMTKATTCSTTVITILEQVPAATEPISLGKLRTQVAIELSNTHSMDDKDYLEALLQWIDKTVAIPMKAQTSAP